jgi:MoaA/NifB/PqqE/SkfB family radical SAM enzyme
MTRALLRRVREQVPDRVKARLRDMIRASRSLRGVVLRIPNARGVYHSVDPSLVRAYNRERRAGPRKLVCYLPFHSITFSGGGRALACTYNQKAVFGTYPETSVKELWFGETGRKLRAYMEHNDLSFGCQHCEYFLKNRTFTGLKAQVFDKYPDTQGEPYPRVMEFDVINTCNLQCIMCNGDASSSIRRNREKRPPVQNPYDAEFVRQLEEFIPHLREAKFFGGEPFLIDIYYELWNRIIEINPEVEMFVLTNGTVLNERVKEVLNRGRFTLGVSIDAAGKEKYEQIRVGADFEQVMKNLDYFAEYSRERRRGIVVSTTLMRENWEEVPRMLELCNAIGGTTYLSYLKRPEHLALWNLPPSTLQEIYDHLQRFDFPAQTESQRFNKRCYQDFLVQLRSWKEKGERGEALERWE